jgi:hypothetical protein
VCEVPCGNQAVRKGGCAAASGSSLALGAARRGVAQRLQLAARIGRGPSSASFISATKRLGTPATVSRPRLRRASVLTTRVAGRG